MKAILIMLLSIFCFHHFYAQQKLQGKVIEINGKADSLPLPGTMLRWQGNNEPAITNQNGNFQLAKSKLSNQLIVSNIGFTSDTLTIDTSQFFVLIVLQDIKQLKEVQIVYRTTGSELSMMNTIKTEVLNQRELMKAACCNLSESFETNASIDVNLS